MIYNPDIHHRSSIRLKGYDYSLAGAYFVTMCVEERKCVFGNIQDNNVKLLPIGKIVERCWKEIPTHFNYVELNLYVIMPNHLHGIVIIKNNDRGVQLNVSDRGVQLNTPTYYKQISPQSKTLSVIIRTFKAAVTTQCRKNNYNFFRWQRNYYEHIIRNKNELNQIQEYIIYNPRQWQFDRDNLKHIKNKSYNEQWGNLEKVIYGESENFHESTTRNC